MDGTYSDTDNIQDIFKTKNEDYVWETTVYNVLYKYIP